MKAVPITLLLMLAACDRDRPPEPTADQHAQLNEADAMLNDMAVNDEEATPAVSPERANKR